MHVLQIQFLQIHVFQIHLLQIPLLQIHVYKSRPVQSSPRFITLRKFRSVAPLVTLFHHGKIIRT